MSGLRTLLVALATSVFASALQAQVDDASAAVDEVVVETVTPTAMNEFQGLAAFIDGYAMSAMALENSPSGTVALGVDGEVIFAKGYGYQDVSERIPVVAETTLFRPGSVSKLFTWVAVMQQVERGNLDLDTNVNQYLETFQIDDTWPDQPVTLRHIMTHTAGFEDGAMGYLIIDDPERIMPLAEAMARYQPYRVNPPGAQTSYSNYATALAGLIVSNVSDLSFNDYIERHIFDVLGMQSASFEEPLPEPLAGNMADTYQLEAGAYVTKPYEIISNFGPAGALAATATDMLKFGLAILNGGEHGSGRILQPDTVDQMLRRQFSHDPRLPGMGLGFYQTEVNGLMLVGHGGDTALFHSELVIDRTNNLVYFVSFGAIGGGAVRSGFKPAFYDQYFPVSKPIPVPPADFGERADKYAGTYRFWRSNFSTIEKALGLQSALTVGAGPDNILMLDTGSATVRYVEVEDNLFVLADPIQPGFPKLAFQEDENGQITGFQAEGIPFMSTYRAARHQTPAFNLTLLGAAILAFVGVWLRYVYRRADIAALNSGEKSAYRSSMFVATANLLVFIVGGFVLSAVGNQLGSSIPFAFKVWLVLPVIAFIAGLYHLYKTVVVWREDLFNGTWARVRFTYVSLAGLFMCWFYWYWNFLGWQYMT